MMLLRLFWEFFKIGLFAVGGGMATIPFLYDLSDRTGWFTYTQLADMIAISESTPGPIGVNMATYVGYEMSGVLGSISTTLGFVAPPLSSLSLFPSSCRSSATTAMWKAPFTVCGRLLRLLPRQRSRWPLWRCWPMVGALVPCGRASAGRRWRWRCFWPS